MIVALMIGRAGSTGFPGKNLAPILGRPLAAYPLMAVRASKFPIQSFVSTDSPEIFAIGEKFGAGKIARPPELATSKALGEDVFVQGYHEIKKRVAASGAIEFVILLFANSPTVSGEMIDQGIEILRKKPDFDSAVSTSVYNMWSPIRARKLDGQGALIPFVPFEVFGDPKTLNCDRDSQGNVFYADMGLSVVRPHCLENIAAGLLPQKWMGKKIHPILSEGGCDVDYAWQMPMVEFWLKKRGILPATPEEGPWPVPV